MMKNLLCAAVMGVASVFSVSAEVLSPYTEQFENPTERPKGWLRGGASSYSQGTYTVKSEGGHSGGYISVNQYSNYWSSYYNNYNYNDILVSPKVEGEVSIWVRKNGADPTLTFFSINNPEDIPTYASDLHFVEGTSKNLLEGKDIDDWTKITVTGIPAGTYIGIRANNLDIDEFTAEKADVVYRTGLVAEIIKEMSGTTIEAGSDGNVTFKFGVSLQNVGDVDFPAAEPGFKVELKNATAGGVVFGTDYITDAIKCGEKVTKSFEMTGKPVIAPNTVSNSYNVYISHEKTGEVFGSLGYFTVVPYEPNPKLMFNETNSSNQSNYNDVNIVGKINLGAGPAGTGRTLWMWNYGTAPLNITSIDITGDFSTETKTLKLDKDEKAEITIAVTGEPGLKEGFIVFNDEVLGELVYDLSGLVTKEGWYSQDFEGEGTPESMIIGKSWNIKDANVQLKALAGEKYIECTSTSYPDKFSTPLLSFGKDEQFYFMAAKSDNTSAKLVISISKDRQEWSEVATILATPKADGDLTFSSDKPTGTGYGTYEFSLFGIDMPEGEYYVQFEAGGARVDNLYGGKQVELAHDLQVVSVGLPKVASVNTRYITDIKLKNLLKKAEKDYKLFLEVDGEKVAEAEETPDMECGEETAFSMRYTPHFEGTYNGQFVFQAGEDRVDLTSFEFEVGPEKAENVYQVGVEKIQTTDPLPTYQNAQCQIIYRAEDLGMDKGMKVTGFHFLGCNTKELTRNLKVWIQNTEDDGFDLSKPEAAKKEDMTLVYDKVFTFPIVGDESTKVYEPILEISFDKPFTYEGNNLRLMIEQLDPEDLSGHNIFYRVDNSAYDYWADKYDNRVIENKKEFNEDLDDEPSWTTYKTGFPVTFFNVAKDVVVAKGNVTNDFGDPVENAVVSFTSDDILYQAKTDAKGAYTMNIANVGLVYVLEAEAEDYDTYKKENVTFDVEKEPEAVNDIKLNFTDRTAVLSGKVISSLTNRAPEDKIEVVLTSGYGRYTGEADEYGNYSVEVPELSHAYFIEVKVGGESLISIPNYTFASKTDTKDISVEWSGVGEISADDCNAPAEYYDLNGVRVMNPEKGVFICRKGNKFTKVIK